MTPEEIERVVRIAASLEIRMVKLTGGEPLLRPDIVDIVYGLSHVPNIEEVAITTNGVYLKKLARPLKAAGLARVNISLGTLDPTCYSSITGIDEINQVVEGIKEAAEVGLSPIKVNMVVLKGLNDDQVPSMIEFTKENGLVLQLIEFESPNPEAYYTEYHSDLAAIERELKKKAARITVRRMQKRRKYYLQSGGEVEVVRPMHNTSFCRNCSRLRVTSDGKFKPCLFVSDNLVDFLTPMRKGATDEEIEKLLLEAVERRRPYFM